MERKEMLNNKEIFKSRERRKNKEINKKGEQKQ